MKKILNEGNQIHNFISSSGSGTVVNYGSGSGSGSDFLTNHGSGSSSTSQKVTVPTVPVPVPQHWLLYSHMCSNMNLDPFLGHTLSDRRKYVKETLPSVHRYGN
jgi:hypothetical protein